MRIAGVLAAAGIAIAGVLGAEPAVSQGPSPQNVSWQSAGDSFSSGEGVFGNEGACAQSNQAYGPEVADLLRVGGWQITNETFTACTGHLVEDYFNPRGDSENRPALWDWGREQGGPERVDVIAMSFGGNDVGFADIIAQCLLVLPDSWGEFVVGGLASSLTGCDESEEELSARADALLDPPRRDCAGTRRSGDAGFDCDLDIGDRRGSIIDFYFDIVTERLTDRGRLYIVGYPRLFADVNQWPGWARIACQGVKRGDTEKLGRLAEHLNNKLQEAIGRTNQALGSDRVVFVDRFAYYRDGLHELCGTGDDWLNGIAVDRGVGLGLRKETSFHPNAAGHGAVAAEMNTIVNATFPRSSEQESRPSPLPFVPLDQSNIEEFETLLSSLGLSFSDDNDAGCSSISIYGVDFSSRSVDYSLDYLIDGERGYECGGDGYATFVLVRNGVDVALVTVCECDIPESNREGFAEFLDMYPGDRRAVIYPQVVDGRWQVWSYENR